MTVSATLECPRSRWRVQEKLNLFRVRSVFAGGRAGHGQQLEELERVFLSSRCGLFGPLRLASGLGSGSASIRFASSVGRIYGSEAFRRCCRVLVDSCLPGTAIKIGCMLLASELGCR